MNIEKLKNIQIVCKNQKDVEDCLNNLEELGFEVKNNNKNYKIIFYNECSNLFENDIRLLYTADVYFYDKEFVEMLKKLIKNKSKDIEVASDGRIMKINNYYQSNERVHFLAVDFNRDDPVANASETLNFNYDEGVMGIYNLLKYGLLFKDDKSLDNYLFKLKIETDLKDIAERLNNGRKINWKNGEQDKFSIYYNYNEKILDYECNYYRGTQGAIYCLDKNFLEVAKKEIGEENLIKYFDD